MDLSQKMISISQFAKVLEFCHIAQVSLSGSNVECIIA